eukprot:COSAG01_NODE_1422_length_10360_cov_36.853815_6_plen_224_part_00
MWNRREISASPYYDQSPYLHPHPYDITRSSRRRAMSASSSPLDLGRLARSRHMVIICLRAHPSRQGAWCAGGHIHTYQSDDHAPIGQPTQQVRHLGKAGRADCAAAERVALQAVPCQGQQGQGQQGQVSQGMAMVCARHGHGVRRHGHGVRQAWPWCARIPCACTAWEDQCTCDTSVHPRRHRVADSWSRRHRAARGGRGGGGVVEDEASATQISVGEQAARV